MYPKKLVIYMAGIGVVAGLLLFRTAVPAFSAANGYDLIFCATALMASLTAVEMIRGNGSVAVFLPILFSASVIMGPSQGVWISALFSVTNRELTGKVKWPSILFNRAMFGLIGWVSGNVFYWLGGSLQNVTSLHSSLALAAGAFIALAMNLEMVAIAIALRHDRTLREIWRVYIRWSAPAFVIMMVVGYLIVTVYELGGPTTELIFLVPLAGIRWIFSLIKSIRYWYQHGVKVMLTALDAKDPYTFGHSMRVGHYAMLLARKMKLPEDVVEQVRNAGLLHDVGKIGTPDDILNKPGRLTMEEQLVMQRHPIIGSSMLTQVHLAGCARDWVLHHHERWDGMGYPDNLAGEEIPIETRIVSVVDAYDAMTSNRAYRPAMGHDEALVEIAAASGTQFDPVVVAKFMELCADGDLAAREGAGHGWDRISVIPEQTEPETPPTADDEGTHSG